jgi:hypothetical protein
MRQIEAKVRSNWKRKKNIENTSSPNQGGTLVSLNSLM